MARDPNNQPDELGDMLRRLDKEFGPRRDDDPPEVYGADHPPPGPPPPQRPPYAPQPLPATPANRPRLRMPRLSPAQQGMWATWVLLVLNVAIYLAPALLDLLGVRVGGIEPSVLVRALGAKNNRAIAVDGEFYRLFTAMFLHGSLIHIGFNAWALYALGFEAERLYGTWRFLALYLLAGLSGSIASYAFTPANSVGASGAIFGLIGGLGVFYYLSRSVLGELARQQLGSLITVLMINLFIGFSSPGVIDNTAHVGGLIGGAAAAWFLAPRLTVDSRAYPPAIAAQRLALSWPGALGLLVLLILAARLIVPPL